MHSNTSSSSILAQSVLHSSSITGDSQNQKRGHSQRHHHTNVLLQPGLFFLASRDVTVCYGPYMVLGVMDYRTDRLQGIKKHLQNAGGEVKLIPSYHVNEVRVWHLERQIFSCQITDLLHGGDGELDAVCKAAEKALEQSIRRAYFNLKYRYQLDACLLEVCPCHPVRHSNDSLARVPCRKNKTKDHTETENKGEGDRLNGAGQYQPPKTSTKQPIGTQKDEKLGYADGVGDDEILTNDGDGSLALPFDKPVYAYDD